jgi:hypothetical protein
MAPVKRLFVLIFLQIPFVSFASECLLIDEYGVQTQDVAEALDEKGFVIRTHTEEPSYFQGPYFVISIDQAWNANLTAHLSSAIRCASYDHKNNGVFWAKVSLLFKDDSIDNRIISIDRTMGIPYFRCANDTDLEYETRAVKSKLRAIEKLKTCSEYLDRIYQ